MAVSTEAPEPATNAQRNNPWSVAVDNTGNVFIADFMDNGSQRIRKVFPSGTITTVAGRPCSNNDAAEVVQAVIGAHPNAPVTPISKDGLDQIGGAFGKYTWPISAV